MGIVRFVFSLVFCRWGKHKFVAVGGRACPKGVHYCDQAVIFVGGVGILIMVDLGVWLMSNVINGVQSRR
jgi:hypothetical protein